MIARLLVIPFSGTAQTTLRTVAFAGDSITDNTFGYPWAGGYPENIAGYLQNSIYGWMMAALGHPAIPVQNIYAANGATYPNPDFGYSGVTAYGYANGTINDISTGANKYPTGPGSTLTPLAHLLACPAAAVFLLIGTNDIPDQSDASVISRLTAILSALRAAGRTVFLGTILPRSGNCTAPTVETCQAKINRVNALLPALCAAYGATLIPWHLAVMEGTGYKSEYFADGLHPNTAGACVLGLFAADAVCARFGPPMAMPAIGSARWQTPNPGMTANNAVAATGYTLQYQTARTIYTDAAGMVWWQCVCGPATTDGFDMWAPAMTQPTGNALIAAETPVRACCEYEIVSGNIGNISLTYTGANSSHTVIRRAIHGNSESPYVSPLPAHRGILLTEKFTLAAGTSWASWATKISCLVRGAGTVRITNMGIFTDP